METEELSRYECPNCHAVGLITLAQVRREHPVMCRCGYWRKCSHGFMKLRQQAVSLKMIRRKISGGDAHVA